METAVKVIHIICAMTMVLSLVVSATAATTHYVAPAAVGGDDSNGGTGWDDAWATIGFAATNVVEYDTILISNGVYLTSEEILITNNISLKGFMDGVIGGLTVASNTIIQRAASGTNAPQHRIFRTLQKITYRYIRFDGLTIANGYLDGSPGAGIYVGTAGTLVLYVETKNCRFLGNVATNSSGGAIYYAPRRYLYVNDCVFADNVAGDGGALGRGGQGAYLANSVFLRNRAHNASGSGGGAVAWRTSGDSVTFTDCTFEGNISASDGGAVSIRYSTYDRSIRHCVFRNNHADKNGGAIWYSDVNASKADEYDIIRCTMLNNSAGGSGGGIYLNNTVPINFYNNLIANNAATNNGGGVWAQDLIARQCTITDNRAGGSGGGIYVSDATPGGIVTNSIVYGNTPDTSVNCSFGFSCVPAGSPGVSNVNTEPQFASIEGTDYALSETSACVDGGTTNVQAAAQLTANWDSTGYAVNLVAITADVAGNPHTDFDGDSIAQPNMGCYELTVPPAGTVILIQ